MNISKKPRINLDLMPESTKDEHCRVLYSCIQDYFRNMTPEQRERYENWCEEYDRIHGLTDSDAAMKGGDECEYKRESADNDSAAEGAADKEGGQQAD